MSNFNGKEVYRLTDQLIREYIEVYKNRAEDKKQALADLRSWSSDKSGISVYLSSSDLRDDFTLTDGYYGCVKMFGLEINNNNGNLGSVSIEVKNDYFLVDIEALLKYVITNISEDVIKVDLKDFSKEATVEVKENTTTVGVIKKNAKLEAKAELLDELMGRTVSFGGK